jgi:tetratricopeptide (TPR) repeat protein
MLSAYQDSNPEQSQGSEKSSKSRKSLPTDRRPYIAATLHNIAIVHMLNLRFKRALPYLTKAVTIRREYLDEGDPDQVVSLYCVCIFYMRSNDVVLISEYNTNRFLSFMLLTQLLKQVSLVKYGICNFALGNFGESQAAFKMALLSTSPAGNMNEVSNEDTIADLAQMGEVLNNLACLSLHAGQATLALQTLKQALEVFFAALSDSLYLSSQRTSSSSILMAISVIRGNVGYIDLKLNESDAAVVAFQASLMVCSIVSHSCSMSYVYEFI